MEHQTPALLTGRVAPKLTSLFAILAAVAPHVAVGAPPVILQHPPSLMVPIGDPLRLSCVVTGTPPIAYIWQRNGAFLSDQTNALLTISNAQPAHSGGYRLIAVNDDGMTRSTNADVIVYTNQPCNFPWAWEGRLRGPSPAGFLAVAEGLAVAQDGSIYVTGPASSQNESEDYLTAKYDAAGRLLWTAGYREGTGQTESARALALDSAGNCIVTGHGYSFKPATDWDNDYVTIKYDTHGQGVWTNRWNSDPTRISWDMPYAIALDDAGNSYVLGTGGLIKLSAQGALLWANTACQGQNGTLRVSGNTVYAAIPWSGAWPSKLFKVDPNGTVLWVKDFGTAQSRSLTDMVTDSSGFVYIVAATNYDWDANTGDIEVAKFDGTGSLVWAALYNGPFGNADYPSAMAVDTDGAVLVTGWTWNTNRARVGADDLGPLDALTIKFDPSGRLLWSATYRGSLGGPEGGIKIAVDGAGNAFVAGGASISSPGGSEAIPFLLKYDPEGNRLWTSTYRNHPARTQGSAFARLALGKPGQIVVAGYSSYRLVVGGNALLEFLVVSYDELTPRLALAGVPAPGVRQGCLVSPRQSVFDVLATTNLLGGQWQTIGTVTNFNGLVPFYDRDAGQHPVRFYRAQAAGQ